MESLLKEHDSQIQVLKQQLSKKEKIEKDLSTEFKQLAEKTSVLSKNHSSLIESNNLLRSDYEINNKSSKEDKSKFESKVKELIQIIEQQSRELDDYNQEFEKLEKENSVLKERLDNYKIQFDEINRQIPEFQKNFEYLNIDRAKMEELSLELEKLLKEEKAITESLTNDKNELISICENFEQKNKEYEDVNETLKKELTLSIKEIEELR